ncbi:hypothetical protein ATO12_24680 [Aquimarina atlantica]|uniref:4Fe4S-binding SPASM domain-containing protein n=1 Tax=Aquimarina atlantica TaxID=1317122 RepID=A0A023BQ71_9FLAO|nr:grasp-with-spasm system SPASM domain peptide maturase [Aquimarina atlantica]EZH72136.1 hypothetical protein ATO12_24680 [Aquimarina atlantica]
MNLNTDLYINVYSTCKLVKGKKRGTLSDLHRSRIELIPNELIDLVNEFKGKKVSDILKKNYDFKDLKVIEQYFDFLIDKEVIFLSEKILSFISSDETYESPKKLLSAIIDIDTNSTYDVPNAIYKINTIGCDNIQIRLYDCDMDTNTLEHLVSLFKNTSFRHVEILLKYNKASFKSFHEILKYSNRVSMVYFHSYDQKDKVEEIDSITYIYTSEKIVSSDFCGYIMPFYFDVSPITYYIGENYNTCLYKKIAVDVNGNIKNCPSMANDFGKIDSSDLDEILSTPDFKKYWNITKDKISVCKTCEFRKVCTDCRAYLKENELYEKPKHCEYEPDSPNW